MTAGRGGVFTTVEGRLRLGWRLCLFVALLVPLYLALAVLLPLTLPGHGLALLGGSLGAGWILLHLDGRPPAALGFPLRRAGLSEAVLGVVLGGVVGLAAVVLMVAAGAVRWSLTPAPPGAFVVAAALSLGLLAPLAAAEEALLRGYPLQALSQAWGPAAALVLTSAVFGLLHVANPGVTWVGVVNTGLAGLFLGALYLRTGSLWWASGAHLGWNWTHGFVLGLPVSGLDVADQPWLESRIEGPELVSGGAFGPEGSLLASTALVAAVAWTWTTRRLQPSSALRELPLLARLRVLPGRQP